MQQFILCVFQLLIFLSTIFVSLNSYAATFHAVLVGDTDDEELKEVIIKDLTHMKAHIHEVFTSLDKVEHLNQRIYTGKNTNMSILNDLRALQVEPDDIIFFYFSGHGFNTKQTQNENWPFLYFNHGDLGINAYSVLNLLMEHQPRLVICFVDCCNNILKPKEIPLLIELEAKKRNIPSLKPVNIRKLFQETNGVIFITSASPGYFSEGTDKEGSCFTNAYIKFFKEKMRLNHPSSWKTILSKAKKSFGKSSTLITS